MRRLCKRTLREAVVDAGTAAAAPALADRHRCAQLRDFCVEYVASPEMLKAVVRARRVTPS
uniref:BPM/SPOP BACK domain-containing protein n=1 Tax=Arundo donax TaxID=35708 RepID=A0A0A9B3Z2_ARUDO